MHTWLMPNREASASTLTPWILDLSGSSTSGKLSFGLDYAPDQLETEDDFTD